MAEQLYIEAKLDANQLYKDLEKLKKDVESKSIKANVSISGVTEQTTEINSLDKQVKEAAKNSQEWTNKNNELTASIKNQTEPLRQAGDLTKQMSTQTEHLGEDYKKAVEEVSKFIVELKKLKQEAKGLTGEALVSKEQEILITQDQLNGARSRMRELTEEVSGRTSAWKSMFQGLGKSISTGLFTTFGAFSIAGIVSKAIKGLTSNMKDGIDIAISFESAFAGVRKTVDDSEYNLRKFDESLREMSKNIPRTYEELAKIAELGGQMGIPLDNLGKFTETLAALEVSTDLGLEDAALQISRIANVTNTAFTSVDKIGSAIVDLGNNFAATESEITNFMQRIAGTGTVVGLTVGDIAGISAAMTSVGIAAEKGGTSVNKMLMAMENAVNQGGEKLRMFAELTGKTVEEFKDKRKRDAGSLFADVVEGLAKAGPDATYYLKELAGGGVRLQETFLNAASAGDTVRSAIEMGNKAYTENIALMEEAAKRYGTMESQLQMLDNEIRLHKEKIGEELLPLLVGWKRTLLELQDVFKRVAVGFKEFIDQIGFGGLVGSLGALVVGLTAIYPPLGILVGLLSTAVIAFKSFKDRGINAVSPALRDIGESLKNVNEKIAENEIAIEELTQKYYEGRIGIDEYNKELDRLIEKKIELDGLQEQAIKNQVAEKAMAEDIAESYAFVNAMKQDMIKSTKDLSDVEKSISKIRDEISKLEEKRGLGIAAGWDVDKIKEVNNSINELTNELYDLIDKRNKLFVSTSDLEVTFNSFSIAAKDSIPTLELFNKYLDDQGDLMELLNSIKYDFSNNIEEINRKKKAVSDYIEKTKEAIEMEYNLLKAQFASRYEWQKGDTVLTQFGKDIRFVLDKITGKYQKAEKEINDVWGEMLDVQKKSVDSLMNGLKSVGEKEVGDILKYEFTNKSKNDLKDFAASTQLTMDKISKETKQWEDLNEKRKEALKLIDMMVAAEEDSVRKTLSNAKTKEDAVKAQTRLLEIEATKKIQYAKDNLSNEESVANEILNIQEWLNNEKKKLNQDWLSSEIDSANELLKKYKELRKDAENAFKDLAKDMLDSSKDIKKIIDEIDRLQKKLSELETKKIEDLGKRYVNIDKTIADLNEKIAETNYELGEQSDGGKAVLQVWDELQNSIKETTKESDSLIKEIDKIKEKMEDLNKSEVDKLSERYAKVTEEIEKLNEELEKYTKYDILTDADATKKLELENRLNSLLYEQAKIRQTLKPEQLERAESMVGETETDKIIREYNEKRAIYQQEVDDLETKYEEQQVLLQQYKEQEVRMVEENDNLILDSGEKKYRELLKKLKDYTEERDKLLKEQTHLQSLLTQQQIQDAINESKKTETQLILDKYYKEKALLDQELLDYRNQLNAKLAELAKFYTVAAELQKKYGNLGVSFSKDDIEKLKEASTNLKGLPTEDKQIYQNQVDIQKANLQEQEDARKKLENIAKNIDKLLTTANIKAIGAVGLQEMLRQLSQLKITAQGGSVSNSSVTNNQTFNVANSIDIDLLVREIRKAIKI